MAAIEGTQGLATNLASVVLVELFEATEVLEQAAAIIDKNKTPKMAFSRTLSPTRHY
jgi:hypothetical protein